MKKIAQCMVLLIIVWSCTACAEEKKQMIVPIYGSWLEHRDADLAEAEAGLRKEFPGIDQGVLNAIFSVPRAAFVTDAARHRAYDDMALPIGSRQATLKLSDIAFILSSVDIRLDDSVLEIGTGTGYFAAILSRYAEKVYSVEIIEYLGEIARQWKKRLNLDNVTLHIGDGSRGWEEHAPYNVIVVTAAVTEIAPELRRQLTPGGVIAAPIAVGNELVEWVIYKNENDGLVETGRRKTSVQPIITE